MTQRLGWVSGEWTRCVQGIVTSRARSISSGQGFLDLPHEVERAAYRDEAVGAGGRAGEGQSFRDRVAVRDVRMASDGETAKGLGYLAARNGDACDDHLAHEGAQQLEHLVGGLVLHRGEYQDRTAARLVLPQVSRERTAARGVVGAVEEQIGPAGDDLEPAGPDRRAEARGDGAGVDAE